METKFVGGLHWQPLLLRFVLCSLVMTWAAWLFYLMKPALVAVFSPNYRNFPWISEKKSISSFLRATSNAALRSSELFVDIHHKVRGAINIHLVPMPHHSNGFILLVPKQLLTEYVKQPDDDISLRRYTLQSLVPDYTTLGAHIVVHPVYRAVVHKELYQKLADKIPMVNEEIVSGLHNTIARKLDENGEAQINVWDTMNKVLSGSANRIISGYPLCRNQEYLDATASFAATFFASALYARFIPPFLRPVLLPWFCRPLTKCRQRAGKHAIPVIRERMRLVDAAGEKGEEPDLPNDMLSAIILAGKKSGAREDYDAETIVARMLVLNFVQSYTNLVTMTNLVYDLVSLPEEELEAMAADLRAEIGREADQGDAFEHGFFQRLGLMDSLIRESIRHSPIGETGLERVVGKKGGFTFSNGVHVPQGALLAAPIKAYQRDERVYGGGFDPRRFVRTGEKVTDISPDFLNFGLGRGACPGRWFTSDLLKCVLVHLLLDYDFVGLERRPENVRKITLDEPCGRELITLRRRKLGGFEVTSEPNQD